MPVRERAGASPGMRVRLLPEKPGGTGVNAGTPEDNSQNEGEKTITSATDIVGYKADADLWCPECALREYGKPPDRAEREIFPGTADRAEREIFPGAPDRAEREIFPGTADRAEREIFPGAPDRAEREIFPGAPDREGNEVFPVFAGAEFDVEPVCGRCGEKLEGCTVTGAP